MKQAEQLQKFQKSDAAGRFCDAMLAELRKRLFAKASEKEWFQDARIIRQAIMEPARYLRERGACLPAEKYRTILLKVVITIEEHGNCAEIRRMSHYFLHAVQSHMRIQGDVYYEEAKASEIRTVAGPLSKVMRTIPQVAQDRSLTEILAASADVLRSKGGRKKATAKPGKAAIQKELF